jgi:hypothetical protein
MVFILPVDSAFSSLVRLSDGVQLTKPRGRESADYVLGLSDGRIVLAGCDPKENKGAVVTFYKINRETRKVSIDSDPSQPTGQTNKLTGRGAIVNDSVYIPCEHKVFAIRLKDKKRHPVLEYRDIKKVPEPGDLIIGGGCFYSVGARNLHMYKEDE